jgi:squalene-hopene/tetraprenyl-beta-curcumene cyclase
MNATVHHIGALLGCLLLAMVALCWRTETRAADAKMSLAASYLDRPQPRIASSWDPKAAASYLDRREGWWMEWPKAARDHGTFCISCHTAVPYALSRPALHKAMDEQAASVNERSLLDNVSKRVRFWNEVAPFYSDADRGKYKTGESRGTESVLNALILASNDAQSGKLSDTTRLALDNMWAEQQTTGSQKGAWLWLRFGNEPWEADDSDYYGATLAALAVGLAPGNYYARAEIQDHLKLLREHLTRECAAQTTINRIGLLWASAKLPGLLAPDQQRAIIQEVLGRQQSDGGWSLSSLVGSWKRADGTPQQVSSDGYATGLIAWVLLEVGIPPENPQEKQALAWLASNQNRSQGFWLGYSLNRSEEHHQSPETARFMSDAATAYAVLALTAADQR